MTEHAGTHADAHTPHEGEGGHHEEHHELSFLRKYIFSTDHKVIGIQFLFSSLFFMIIGGSLAVLIRIQLAYPDATPAITRWLFARSNDYHMAPHQYAMVVSMHASVMIFFVIIPVLTGAFGNFLIPLQVGYKDMAFPLMNMFSYWFMVPAFTLILCSFFTDGGAASACVPACSVISLILQFGE